MGIMINIQTLQDLEVTTKESEDLYLKALEHSDLTAADYQTIRDLLKMAGLSSDINAHGLLIGLFQHVADGSLCMDMNPEVWSRTSWLQEAASLDKGTVKKLIAELKKKGILAEASGETIEDVPPVPLIVQKNQDKKRTYIYFQKYYTAEKKVRLMLKALLNLNMLKPFEGKRVSSETPENQETKIQSIVRDVFNSMPHHLHEFQLLAVMASLFKPLAVISGGPGTGKTTTAAAVLRCMVRLGAKPEDILLTAPTGRAAQRLKESIQEQLKGCSNLSLEENELLKGLESKTIHRALKFSPFYNRFFYGEKRKLKHKVIVVDEVSMVDVFIMGSLLDAVDDNARIIFMGDKDQLPSVDAGAVLEDLIPEGHEHGFSSELIKLYSDTADIARAMAPKLKAVKEKDDIRRDHVVILEHSYRSVKQILDLANSLNHGKVDAKLVGAPLSAIEGKIPWPGTITGKGVTPVTLLEPVNKMDSWQNQLYDWAAGHYRLGNPEGGYKSLLRAFNSAPEGGYEKALDDIFTTNARARILTLIHGGREGDRWINRIVNAFMLMELDSGKSFHGEFNGASIIITTNDYNNQLYNGDTGVILKKNGEYRAWFFCEGEYRSFSVKSLVAWEPAWAITVHKSQGSEYNHVLLVLPSDIEHRMLSREILYTGITRAKDSVVIRGTVEALNAGAERTIDRESGIELW